MTKKPSPLPSISLSPEKWDELLGTLDQSTRLMIQQLATLPEGMKEIEKISTSTNALVAEMKRQLGK